MIACRGYYQALSGEYSDFYLNAVPGLGLASRVPDAHEPEEG